MFGTQTLISVEVINSPTKAMEKPTYELGYVLVAKFGRSANILGETTYNFCLWSDLIECLSPFRFACTSHNLFSLSHFYIPMCTTTRHFNHHHGITIQVKSLAHDDAEKRTRHSGEIALPLENKLHSSAEKRFKWNTWYLNDRVLHNPTKAVGKSMRPETTQYFLQNNAINLFSRNPKEKSWRGM